MDRALFAHLCSNFRIFQCPLRIIFFCVLGTVSALDVKPWLGNVAECELQTAFTYSRYDKVQGATPQLKSTSNDKLIRLDLGMSILSSCDVQLEAEFADTPRQSWGMRSVALQARALWLNDIAGDPCSVVTSFNIRGVSGHSLHDVSSPYHAQVNFELNSSVGKEWSRKGVWTMRTFGLAGVGMANRGFPWLRGIGGWEANWQDTHRLGLFIHGYFGLGDKRRVNIEHFNGWAQFAHRSIDLCTAYAYQFGVWGTLSVQYAYRIFAKTFPERVNFFTICYCLPFSFF